MNSSIPPRCSATDGVPQHLRQTADVYRLRLRRDECGDPVIFGRRGQLYPYDNSLVGVLVFCRNKTAWTHVRKKLVAAGFTLLQNCDTEGTATFDPQNPKQVNLAIRVAEVKRKRRVSPETAARLTSFAKARRGIAAEALLGARTIAEGRGHITAYPNQLAPETSSPAIRPVQMNGGK